MRSVTRTGLCEKLVYMHMPKCGGTSFSEALYAAVPIARRVGVIDARATRRAAAMKAFGKDDVWLCHDDLPHGAHTFELREALLLQHMAWDTHVIHGHVLYSDLAQQFFGERYHNITLLRAPQDRMVSNYRMARHAGLITDEFSEYLRTPLARQHAHVYLRYLSGQAMVRDEAIPAATEIAIARGKAFAWIGFLDRLEDLKAGFQNRFDVSLNLPSYNRARAEHPTISPEDTKRMQALLAPDQEIFDSLRGRWLS